MIYYILVIICLMLTGIVYLLARLYNIGNEIKFHLQGIDKKEIISIGDEPRIFTRSDEDEYEISKKREPED